MEHRQARVNGGRVEKKWGVGRPQRGPTRKWRGPQQASVETESVGPFKAQLGDDK